MSTGPQPGSSSRFRLLEAIVILGVLLLLAALILPALQPARRRSGPLCVNNLKQMNLALSLFAEDHSDQYPWQISTNDGGVKEWVGTRKTFLLFAALSNEVNNPRVLWCPKDTGRWPSLSFIKPGLDNNNLSYFVGLDARAKGPLATLFGDRNLVVDGRLLANGTYLVSTQQVVVWGAIIHQHAGNMSFNDGSVHQLNDQKLSSLFFSPGRATNFIAIP